MVMTSSTAARPRLASPLIDRVLPLPNAAARVALQLTLGVALLAALAQVRLEIGPVPVTGQTFGVLLLAAAYGLRLGTVTMLLYLGLGGLGLGVFSGGAGGLAALTGTTAGYLAGFVPAAAVVGWLAQRGLDRSALGMAFAMTLGNLVIYACGVANLLRFVPDLGAALAVGVWPFLLGDALKLALAVALVPAAWRTLRT
jgi:biotin transport system substrate-specific component